MSYVSHGAFILNSDGKPWDWLSFPAWVLQAGWASLQSPRTHQSKTCRGSAEWSRRVTKGGLSPYISTSWYSISPLGQDKKDATDHDHHSCIQLYPAVSAQQTPVKSRATGVHKSFNNLSYAFSVHSRWALHFPVLSVTKKKNHHPDWKSCYLWLYIGCSVCGSALGSSHTLMSHRVTQGTLSVPPGNTAHKFGPQPCEQWCAVPHCLRKTASRNW